ncbi:MAG: TRAP transporter substrate-binding protein DctP [Burkholderiaceae bacterium]|nr:TRAP transporter substrate-binding protein DctP [Burkholderiaceae bacterium]
MQSSRTLLATAVIAAAQALLPATASAQNKRELVYGSFASPSAPDSKAAQAFLDRLNAEAGLSVRFRSAFGGAMGGPREVLANIGSGVLDSGQGIDGLMQREFAGSALLRNLGILSDNEIAATGAANETMLLNCDRCRQDAEASKVLTLAYYTNTNYVLLCRSALQSAADFGSKRVRAAGEFAAVVRYMGATPVQIPFPETYEALQRGQVECSHSQIGYLRSLNFWDVAKHVYEDPIGSYNSAQLLAINRNLWRSLPAADRDTIRSRLASGVADAVFRGLEEEKEVRALAAGKGVTFAKLPAELSSKLAQWRTPANMAVVVNEAAQRLSVKDADKLAATFREKLDKWNRMLPEISKSRDAFAAALDREVFSKVGD